MIKAKTASKNPKGVTINGERVLVVKFTPAHIVEMDDAPLDTAVGSPLLVPDTYIAHTEAGKVQITKRVYKRLRRQLSRT